MEEGGRGVRQFQLRGDLIVAGTETLTVSLDALWGTAAPSCNLKGYFWMTSFFFFFFLASGTAFFKTFYFAKLQA